MPSSTTVIYNGVTLRHVRITEYRVDNPANHGSPQSQSLLHTISGEGIVFGETGDEGTSNGRFAAKLANKLNEPRRKCKIEIEDANGKFALYDTITGNVSLGPTAVDEGYGPFFRANVTQITGTKALMVNFTMEFAKTTTDNIKSKIRSFFCTASFSIDEMGLTTIRKTGSLQIKSQPSFAASELRIAGLAVDRYGASDTATFQDPYRVGDYARSDVVVDFISSNGLGGDFADYYRRFVSGNLYRGFRRIRQEYALDESRTRLIFDVTDQEFTRGLPAPARVGDCSYTFERAIEDGALLGIKHFIASVKGDRNVTAGALLTLCIRLSQNRIDWKNDLIMKIRVTEDSMLSENGVTFEVVAKATSAQDFSPSATENEASAGEVTPIKDNHLLLRNILSAIKVGSGNFEFVPTYQPDAYGGALIVRVTPGVSDSNLDQIGTGGQFNMPTTFQLGEQNAVIYSFPNGIFDTLDQQQQDDGINRYILPDGSIIGKVGAGFNKKDLEKNATRPDGRIPKPPQRSKARAKIDVDTGLFAVISVSPKPKTRLVQFRMPVARKTESHDSIALNESPKRYLPDTPGGKGMYVASYSFGVDGGNADLNGNRMQSLAADRTTIITCPDDIPTTGGASTVNPAFERVSVTMNGVTSSVIRFFPDKLDMPQDLTQGNYAELEEASRPSYTAGLGTKENLA